MARASLNDIALRLGISKMTVSRALRGGKHVEVELRERIVQTAEEMGYRPDPEIAKLMPEDGAIRYAGNAGNLRTALDNMRANIGIAVFPPQAAWDQPSAVILA